MLPARDASLDPCPNAWQPSRCACRVGGMLSRICLSRRYWSNGYSPYIGIAYYFFFFCLPFFSSGNVGMSCMNGMKSMPPMKGCSTSGIRTPSAVW